MAMMAMKARLSIALETDPAIVYRMVLMDDLKKASGALIDAVVDVRIAAKFCYTHHTI
jgi:hypothetical protein